jgi:hypothetical protein
MKLNALEKRPIVRSDLGWTETQLARLKRWTNYSRRSGVAWEDYDASAKTARRDAGMPLLELANA